VTAVRVPTDDQRVAFTVLDRAHTGALLGRSVGRPWPRDYPDLCRALRALDRLVFGDVPESALVPGEAFRRWEWHYGERVGVRLPDDRMPGCRLADALRRAAGLRAADPAVSPDEVMEQELRRLFGAEWEQG
jgi:hypothetical protein